MGIYIEIERVYSFGNGRSDKYTLICNGNLTRNRIISLKPITQYKEKVNGKSINHCTSTEVYSAPFSANTNIIVRVRHQENIWLQMIQIDIYNWRFSVQPYKKESAPLPNELAYYLLSSFGIKRGKDARSLSSLASSNLHRHVEFEQLEGLDNEDYYD
ncbi:hypothetical protein [Lederbergia lenta]|uniref:hypothetical protein n=1 Tax=Lederbergia lenta TaxID=1467 RepID=UPI002041F494|nr:hypothetical protein [Lederbergia lenta]MCM3112020.1 hypothetical protein [Lederbergia lenta]